MRFVTVCRCYYAFKFLFTTHSLAFLHAMLHIPKCHGASSYVQTSTTLPHAKVAITIQNVKSTMRTDSVSENSDSVLHFTCFSDGSDIKGDGDIDGLGTKKECCQNIAMMVENLCRRVGYSDESQVGTSESRDLSALLSSMPFTSAGTGTDADVVGWMQNMCLRIASPIPFIDTSRAGNEEEWFPRHHMAIYLQGRALRSGQNPVDASGISAPGSLVQYVSNAKKDGRWSYHFNDVVSSPLTISQTSTVDSTGQHVQVPYHVSLDSNLSSEGGMHRSFVHTITISTSPSSTSPSALNSLRQGKLYMMLPQSEGIFLDMDDPIQDDYKCTYIRYKKGNDNGEKNDCSMEIKMITASPTTVIDIEQPSFVSPQHMVAFSIAFQIPNLISGNNDTYREHVSSESEWSLCVEFTSNLHVRYPRPISRENIGGEEEMQYDGYVNLYIPTPFLHYGELQAESQSSSSSDKDTLYVLNLGGASHEGRSGTWENASIQVAAGFEEHHNLVMVMTVLVSLIGAWRILYDLSTVSTWK